MGGEEGRGRKTKQEGQLTQVIRGEGGREDGVCFQRQIHQACARWKGKEKEMNSIGGGNSSR